MSDVALMLAFAVGLVMCGVAGALMACIPLFVGSL